MSPFAPLTVNSPNFLPVLVHHRGAVGAGAANHGRQGRQG